MAGSVNHPGRDESVVAGLWAQAAHDLRQPVQAAVLLTSMLDDISEPAELRRTARHIGSALQSLSDMLELLTLLARIEAGTQVVPMCTCSIADDLEPALQALAGIAAQRGASLRIGGLTGSVKSHPKLLVAAGRSLVLNAIKHGVGPEIEVSCRRTGDHIGLEVRFGGVLPDAGSNKPAFVQLSGKGDRLSVGELGLGLPLLKHLCRQLGHDLQHRASAADSQQLVLMLPSLPAP